MLQISPDNPIFVKAVLNAAAKRLKSPRKEFLKAYSSDPVAFAHDCFTWQDGQGPVFYQDEILAQIPLSKRVSARGPRGLGKTSLSSWAVIWYALTREMQCLEDGLDWKIPTTAGAWRQLVKFLWPEIHKWARRLDWSKIPLEPFNSRTELLNQSLKLSTGEAFAVASDTPDLIEGSHADHMLYLFDEAKAITHKVFDAVEGSFSGAGHEGQEAFVMAMSTPGERSGRFYDIQTRKPGYEHWWVRHVTLEECVEAGRITKEWVEQCRRSWGEESPVYQSQVLGEFPEQLENALINISWLESARQNEFEPNGLMESALDVARFGDDRSVHLFVQAGQKLIGHKYNEQGEPEPLYDDCASACVMRIESWQGHDLMDTAGRVKFSGVPTAIDTIGVGAGVYDRLYEQGFNCTSVNVGEAASDSEHFFNLRAELYWKLREAFREQRVDLTRIGPEDYDRLAGELSAILYEYTSKGQIKIEPKDEIKKRLNGHSPDYADALMLTRATNSQLIGINLL